MIRRLLVAAVFVAGCQMAEPKGPTLPEESCGASDYQGLVGKSLAAITMPADLNARIVPHGGAVTLDYDPDRMNIFLDRDGRIESITCG
ncbi:MAG: hypothetical protein CSA72_03560 [Rhodobacterales bacterium]|nr:MAG: hypothetical protein CSA72_03560 [Rhodobacterales bacterium]